MELLRSGGGQSVITATDLAQVPGSDQADVQRLAVAADGTLTVDPAVRVEGVVV